MCRRVEKGVVRLKGVTAQLEACGPGWVDWPQALRLGCQGNASLTRRRERLELTSLTRLKKLVNAGWLPGLARFCW